MMCDVKLKEKSYRNNIIPELPTSLGISNSHNLLISRRTFHNGIQFTRKNLV
jgi:hypothetical protein